jgi:uncharacterized phiE125 gp8 family phage protein
MRVIVVTPPEPVVSWDDADAHLRLFGDDSDKAYVEGLIASATAHLDGPAGGWLGRAIGAQTLEARLDNFDCGSIRLPFEPVREIDAVRYIDAAGAEVTIDPAQYELQGASLVPAYGATWPTPRWARETVRITYQAGYAAGKVPAPIKTAILMMVGDWYQNRETSVPSANATAVPMAADVAALLQPYRVYR